MNWSVLTISAIMIIPGSVAPVYPGSGENKIQYKIQSRLAAGEKPNKLIHEKSPYLLQHAFNPIDWYPWGKTSLTLLKNWLFCNLSNQSMGWLRLMSALISSARYRSPTRRAFNSNWQETRPDDAHRVISSRGR